MTHNFLETSPVPEIVNEWENLLRILNWHPQSTDGKLGMWMRSLRGISTYYATFTGGDADRLRSLVNGWLSVQRHAFRFMVRLSAQESARLRKRLESQKVLWSCSPDGALVPWWYDDVRSEGFDATGGLFLHLIADSKRWRLSAPCSNCGKYFLRHRRMKAEKKYCSQCRRYESGPRMKKIRDKRHKTLLTVAREAVREWALRPKREDWKAWVIRKVNNVNRDDAKSSKITVKSLTRWVNAGELKAPAVARKSQRKGKHQ